jgi:hypothetical protein
MTMLTSRLLAAQRAGQKHPGASLLSRLAKPAKPSAVVKRSVSGNDKIARAKKSMAMDVNGSKGQGRQQVKDKPKEAPKAKTVQELDEDMRAYERTRRFA